MAGRFSLRSGTPSRIGECYDFAYRVASGTLSAAAGKGVFRSVMHLGGPPTDIGIFDNTAASGGSWQVYISGASAGQTYTFDREFNLGLAVQLSAAAKVGVKFLYE